METIGEYREILEIRRHVRSVVDSLELCSLCNRVTECGPSPFPNSVGIWYCADHMPVEGVGVLAPIDPDDPMGEFYR